MLHGVGRRGATRRLRDARPPHRRTPGHHPRGSAGGAARALGRRIRRTRGQPVRLLHAGHRPPAGRARRRRDGRRHRRGATSSRPCAPTCAGARAGSPSSTPRAARWASTAPRARPPAIPGTRCWPPGAPRSKGRPFRARAPTSSSAGAASPTTRRHPTRSSSWAPTDRSPPACAPPGPGADACRAGTARCRCRTPSRCRTGTGPSPCRRPGSSPPTSSRTRVGPAPATAPPLPWRTAARSGASATARCPTDARELADATGDAVRVLWRREDVVRRGPKRPPLAVALRADGTGVVRVGRTERSADLEPLVARVRACCPGVEVEMVDVDGPPVSSDLRGAGWAEVLAARAVLAAADGAAGRGEAHVDVPGAGSARVELHARRRVARPGRGRRVGGRDPLSRDAALLRARRGASGARHGVERGDRPRRRPVSRST